MTTLTVARATRPNFLILAPLCVLLGVSVAARQSRALESLDIVLVLVGGLLAHAVVNLLNEYDDFRSGLDLITRRTPFSGGSGALPAAPKAASQVLLTALVMAAGVVAIGFYFIWLRGWPMLLLGLSGMVLMVAYTRWITRSPWLCLLAPGLGFGPIMVLGSVIALGGRVDATALLGSAVALLLVSELLLINQFPDREADRRVGRRHLPIVLGLPRASRWVATLLLGAYGLIALGQVSQLFPMETGPTWLTFPAALWVALRLPRVLDDHQALMRMMGVNVATLLATLALLAGGLGWA
ncbi:prenyltransferase [Halomonas sp. HP20-15]|uniref:prenyltransferase n=1 Tax=Halomonas sp. HP20-15 TaxID=3085901 RepID=UPI00298173EC|nr:prenyltransferase [Halomonas sp. HP20-15]MDW5378162.1 prenyltransferase [Halomonas sp. HP20-15]